MARDAAKACRKLLCCKPVLLVQGEVVSGGKVKHTPSTAVSQHGWRQWAMSLGGWPAWVCEGSTTRAFVQRLTPQEACAWWGRAFSADIDRHTPPVRPITRPQGVLCDIDGAPKRLHALAPAASSYLQAFTRDDRCCGCDVLVRCTQARRAGHHIRRFDAATRVKTRLPLDKLNFTSSHMVFRLCPERHRRTSALRMYNAATTRETFSTANLACNLRSFFASKARASILSLGRCYGYFWPL